MEESKPIWSAIRHSLRAANLMFAFATFGGAVLNQPFMGGACYGTLVGFVGGALFGLFAYVCLVR